MSNKDLLHLCESIDLTLNQPGAHFQLEKQAKGIINSGYGVASFFKN